MALSGFWSYVHDDDNAEGGRISQLGRDLAAQFELLTGDSIHLFLDRDSLEWGAQWKARIEASLANVAFFVPVLTPRYFASVACRSELQSFARRAERFGVRTLLLPILYGELPPSESEDELVDLARSFQWADWRAVRFTNRDDGAYRRAVHELAQRLALANRHAETPAASDVVLGAAESLETPGTLEVLGAYEEAIPVLTDTTLKIAAEIARVGSIATSLTPKLEKIPSGTTPFVWRLQVVRELSIELKVPTQELARLGDTFAVRLHDMDLGVRALIAIAPSQPENRDELCRFFLQVRELSIAADEGLGSLESMLESAAGLELLSRDIRPVVREMRQGLTLVLEGRRVMAQWVAQIEELDIDCSQAGGR